MNIESRIDAIGNLLQLLVLHLKRCGFRFDRPDEVLPGPELDAIDSIRRIESEVGELPLALKLFWLRIGSVDLCGFHSHWGGCQYPDPLVVYPPSLAVDELDQFVADRDERLRHNFTYLVPIAPDSYHKAGVSGGMWYNISVPAVTDDPPVNDEWHHTTFLNYLEKSIAWGGFPGLERCPDHSWPIDAFNRLIPTGP